MGFLLRVWLLMLLPLRVFQELIYTYIWHPAEKSPEHNYHSNGKHHKNGSAKHEKSIKETLDDEKLSKEVADELEDRIEYWWGANYPVPVRLRRRLRGLRTMNKVRIPLIIEAYYKHVLNREKIDLKTIDTATPLLGAKICDVGCGGGYLSEALVQLGADVVGVDNDQMDIMAAKTHWKEHHGPLKMGPDYVHKDVKEFSLEHPGEFDLVICSEQLQYRPNALEVVPYICKLAKDDGCVLFTTNNRSVSAFLFIIAWMEHVAGTMPPFTHRLHRFIKPEEIDDVLRRCGFETVNLAGYIPLGMTLSLKWRMQWWLTSFIGVWYSLTAKKLSHPIN